MARSVFLTALVMALMFVAGMAVEDRGWGSHIDWMTLSDAKKRAAADNKPVMLLLWKTWCGACKQLRPKFAADPEIAALSKEFVMVQTADEEEPSDEMYRPDGGYIPRILFLAPNGEVMKDITNQAGNPRYAYFYPSPAEIVDSMRKAVARVKLAAAGTHKEL